MRPTQLLKRWVFPTSGFPNRHSRHETGKAEKCKTCVESVTHALVREKSTCEKAPQKCVGVRCPRTRRSRSVTSAGAPKSALHKWEKFPRTNSEKCPKDLTPCSYASPKAEPWPECPNQSAKQPDFELRRTKNNQNKQKQTHTHTLTTSEDAPVSSTTTHSDQDAPISKTTTHSKLDRCENGHVTGPPKP